MKPAGLILIAGLGLVLLQSCTGTRRFGTTVERDEQNPCLIHIIIQIAIQGTDADVEAVKNDLESCMNKECFIPCENDETKGCKTKITTVVKKYSSLKEDELQAFHYVQMIDNDGLPSNAYLGTPNKGISSGVWRRGEPPGTYCHEVLHFCGLADKYCSRLFDPVAGTTQTELNCDPPPDPNGGACCSPSAQNTRCCTPCEGHDHNLMATLSAPLTCANIRDVLKGAGLDSCPEECCKSGSAFHKPPDEIYITPGYLHFGDKNTSFGSIGVGAGYSKYIGSSIGITISGGYYTHTDKQGEIKETSTLMNITGGATYQVTEPSKSPAGIRVSIHAQAGISRYSQKITYGGNKYSNHEISFLLKIGAALDMRLNKNWFLRLLQADYAPTFFYNTTQQNYILGAGIVYKVLKR
jgi:hypothetical protein